MHRGSSLQCTSHIYPRNFVTGATDLRPCDVRPARLERQTSIGPRTRAVPPAQPARTTRVTVRIQRCFVRFGARASACVLTRRHLLPSRQTVLGSHFAAGARRWRHWSSSASHVTRACPSAPSSLPISPPSLPLPLLILRPPSSLQTGVCSHLLFTPAGQAVYMPAAKGPRSSAGVNRGVNTLCRICASPAGTCHTMQRPVAPSSSHTPPVHTCRAAAAPFPDGLDAPPAPARLRGRSRDQNPSTSLSEHLPSARTRPARRLSARAAPSPRMPPPRAAAAAVLGGSTA